MATSRLEATVRKWLTRMTLRQKIGQMTMGERASVTPDDVKRHALGAVLSGGGSHPGENRPEDWVRMNDAFWQAAVADHDGPGIPILYGVDAVHGHNNLKGATIFPHNIGLGAAGDAALVAETARATAREVLATGIEWNFAPVLAVAKNPQWGRTYESFGSNPQRVGELGLAYAQAMQEEGVMGCVKHWVGDGGTAHGMDQGETTLAWEAFEANHVAPYRAPLQAGVHSVMVSFSSWNGDKCHGHPFLVTELLKKRFGFEGIVVSDWDGVKYLDEDFGVAVRNSVNAGLDMFMVPERWLAFIDALDGQVRQGMVPIERIDDAVRRILLAKLRYGLFDQPRPAERPGPRAPSLGCIEHRNVAARAVRRSLVLLKNQGNVLPLAPSQRILVAGKNAHNLGHQCGGWTLSWQGEAGNGTIAGTTIWEGIRQLAPKAELVANLAGADTQLGGYDVAVAVIGETPYAEGFGDIRSSDDVVKETATKVNGLLNPLEPYGTTLTLAETHPEDVACIRRIAAAGLPVVVVLVSGRPLAVDAELAAASAFVAAWLPGSEGQGVAQALLGRCDFAGRLPMPWPGAAGQERFPAGHGLRLKAR